jgi:hypothetical protein
MPSAFRHEDDEARWNSVTACAACEIRRSNVTDPRDRVSMRYMVDDVEKSVAFYTKFLGFEV